MNDDEKQPVIEETPKDRYRLHTFLEKGPNRREVEQYLERLKRFLPVEKGSRPLTAEEIDRYFRSFPKRVEPI